MENNLQVFTNAAFGQVRVVERDGEPWFVGKDVAEILGYGHTRMAVVRKVDEEDKGVSVLDTPGGKQELTIINESGLYSLILSSKLPTAKQFKRWVTSEVLPAIRKHSMYLTPQVAKEATEDPQVFLARAMLVAQDVIMQQTKKLQEQRQAITKLTPKAKKYDKYMKAEDSYTISDVAMMNGISPDRLFLLLKTLGWLEKPYRGSHILTAEAPQDYFKVIKTYYAGSVRGTQIRVTVTGYRKISKLIAKEIL